MEKEIKLDIELTREEVDLLRKIARKFIYASITEKEVENGK